MRYSRNPLSGAVVNGASGVRRAVLMIGAILVLSACTTYYVHPHKKTNADFIKDKRDCQTTAEREASRKGTRACDEVDRCLVATKGWRRD